MKINLPSILDTTKKKAAVTLICGALVAAIGAGTAFAASTRTSLLAKVENGVRSYSTDGGETWSEKTPEGMGENGKGMGVTEGISPEKIEGVSLAVKEENGVTLYSTDGGETWSENAPDGVAATKTTDGKITISNGTPLKADKGGGVLSKVENGVRSYSTDGGETWSEKAPEGMTENGKGMGVTEGIPPEKIEGVSLAVKVENGVTLYSTDNGETWSENAPEGVTKNGDGAVMYKYNAASR